MQRFRLSDFKIEGSAIGSGGFGEVFEARPVPHLGLPEKVALKKVKKTVSAAKVRNEYDIMKQLEHRNIVKFYGNFSENGDHYLIMELCEYGDLRKYVKTNGRMKEIVAAKVLKQLICAVRYWHKKDIMHRDLSAGNILIAKLPTPGDDHADPVVKVTDFGLARELNMRPAQTFAGTPGYMPPEMHNGEEYNEATDVYALGVLLYFMLTGDEPRVGMPLLRELNHDVKELIASMTAPQNERVSIGRIQDSQFMRHYAVFDTDNRDRSSSRGRISHRSSERSGPLQGGYRRLSSQSRERRPEVLQPERRAARPEMRQPRPSRTEPMRSRSRADSGVQSAGQQNTVPVYCEGSVANCRFEKWPVQTIRLAEERIRTDITRLVIDEQGGVTNEMVTDRSGFVKEIVQIRFNQNRQIVEIYEPSAGTRLPNRDDPLIAARWTRGPYMRLQDMPEKDRNLYRKTCYTLWQMGRNLLRVELWHPLFPWARVKLMENGYLRIEPFSTPQGTLVRNHDKKNGEDIVTYRSTAATGNGTEITEKHTIKNIETVYQRALYLERMALEDGYSFPFILPDNRNHPNGPEKRGNEGRPTRGRSSSVTGYASVASAPSQLCGTRHPLQEVQPVPPSRVPSRNDARVSAPSLDPRSAPYQRQPTASSRTSSRAGASTPSHDQRRLDQATTSRTHPEDYDIVPLEMRDKRVGYYKVTHRPSGRYLRMSTAQGVWDHAVYKDRRDVPDEQGIRFKFTNPLEVPSRAADLVEQLQSFLRGRKAESARNDPRIRDPHA